jgi:phosphomannomutase/phosphoglucomutase
MDLKLKLPETFRYSGKKHIDKRLIYFLGIFGLSILVLVGWLTVADWRASSEVANVAAEKKAAVELLINPVQSLKRILNSEQVQNLAVRELENPETTGDLFAYVNGRMNQITAVDTYSTDLSILEPSDMGLNGFAVFDMIYSALEGNQSLMQIHQVLQPSQMVDAVPIKSGDEIVGIIVVTFDPAYILSSFDPTYSSLGVIRLAQNNGRQPLTILREFGDPGMLGEVPDRLVVPGSMFRLEFPAVQHVGLIGQGMLYMLVLAGFLCLMAAFVLYRSNQKWSLEQKKEEARKMRSSGTPPATLAASPDHPQIAPRPEAEATAGAEVSGEPDGLAMPQSAEPPPPLMKLHYDIAERRRQREAEHSPVELTAGIFRAYDIRGVIDKTLDSGVARNVGQAVGTAALEKNASPVVVARDGRLSGPYLMDGMIEGIVSTGCDVLDIGAVPTGVLYYAAHEIGAGSGVMITGSHNPPDYNGFKVMIGGDTLHGEAISGLYQRIVSGQLKTGQGEVTKRDVVGEYIERIAGDIQIERPLRIVIDCGNGIGGVCAADTLRAIGAEVLPLFDEVDGTFPNHHPDPSEPENLSDLIESVRLMDADLGLALDGDADRLGVVTLAGNIIFPDRVMMLLALDVLDRHPGATIIYDVKCTGHLPDVIREAGGVPMMYKTGHSLIKAKMKEIGSPFAGEMSGHFFFEDRWYGVDDGIYAAARLLEILGSTETPPEAILNALPSSYSTPELKVHMQEGENHDFIEVFRSAARFEGAQISTIDGLRADFPDFDAETEEALERIKNTFRSQMLEVNPDLELPF